MKQQFQILKGWENYIDDFWDVSISINQISMQGWFSTAMLNKYLSLGFVFETVQSETYTHFKGNKDSITITLTIKN